MDCDKVAKLELVDCNGEHLHFTHCVATGKQAELVVRDLKKDMLICVKENGSSRHWKHFTFSKRFRIPNTCGNDVE